MPRGLRVHRSRLKLLVLSDLAIKPWFLEYGDGKTYLKRSFIAIKIEQNRVFLSMNISLCASFDLIFSKEEKKSHMHALQGMSCNHKTGCLSRKHQWSLMWKKGINPHTADDGGKWIENKYKLTGSQSVPTVSQCQSTPWTLMTESVCVGGQKWKPL